MDIHTCKTCMHTYAHIHTQAGSFSQDLEGSILKNANRYDSFLFQNFLQNKYMSSFQLRNNLHIWALSSSPSLSMSVGTFFLILDGIWATVLLHPRQDESVQNQSKAKTPLDKVGTAAPVPRLSLQGWESVSKELLGQKQSSRHKLWQKYKLV